MINRRHLLASGIASIGSPFLLSSVARSNDWRLRADTMAALRDAPVAQRLTELGADPVGSTPE